MERERKDISSCSERKNLRDVLTDLDLRAANPVFWRNFQEGRRMLMESGRISAVDLLEGSYWIEVDVLRRKGKMLPFSEIETLAGNIERLSLQEREKRLKDFLEERQRFNSEIAESLLPYTLKVK